MADYLSASLTVETFCTEFTKLWMRERDAAWGVWQAKKSTWSQPYDELLLAAFQRGEMGADEFRKKYARLRDCAVDPEFEIISPVHSACSVFMPDPELEGEIDEAQLRHEVEDALGKCRAMQARTAEVAP